MKSLPSLYRLAERRDIDILHFPLPLTESMSLESESGAYYIAMDEAALDGESDERTHLAHELGHCVTGSFYNRYTKYDVRQRHENRADKWAIRKLISVDELDDAVAEGHTELWDLAAYFGVTDDFMRKAVCLYVHGNLDTELYF